MSGWMALTASLGAAMFAWRASPSASYYPPATRKRARWFASACAVLAVFVWIDALGCLPGACAACASIGLSCSVMPFVVEAVRRLRKPLEGGRACRTAS